MVRGMLAAYNSLLSRHRLATSTVSGAVLGGAGDVAVQLAKGDEYNYDRTWAFTAFGGVITGPVNYVWLEVLETIVARVAPAGGARAVLAKVLLQSSVLQPFIYLPTFYSVNTLVRGWTLSEAMEHVQAEYAATLCRIWVFWTPAVVYTFARLPKHQIAVFFAGVGFAWNCVLSLYNGAGPNTAARPATEQARLVASPTPMFARRPSKSSGAPSEKRTKT